MDNRDILNLYEAYVDIYGELDEAKKMKGKDPCWKGYEMVGTKKKSGREVPNCVPKEEVDIYDIVLSHLLDEGYAETEEAAEKIMVNMSEDWMNNILDEARVDWHNRDQSNVTDRVNVLRDRNRRNVSGVPDGYQTAVRRTRHDVFRGKKKQKGLKTTSDNLGKQIRGPYRKQQYKRTGNDLYKD